MRPLTLDDVLPLADYVPRRREFFESQERYLDRYRRVRIGPQVTLQFENRQTLWFRVQEVLRVARLTEPERVRQQLQLYNRLLPGKSRLQAAFLIETLNPSRATDDFKAWESLAGENVFLCLGSERLPSRLITCRPEDRALGGAHWVEFPISTECRGRLDDPAVSAHFAVELDGYRHESAPLAEEVRHSLAEDLQLSDQD